MLIMPLHRRMTRANFPIVTFVLVALNVGVLFFLQSGDVATLRRAAQYYQQVHLGHVEFPAYTQWLDGHDGSTRTKTIMRRGSWPAKLALIESDQAFLAALHGGRIITPSSKGYATWHAHRARFEAIRGQAFTLRHAVRYSHIEPVRMLWAMFMHGGLMHLVGNMLFLIVLGLLVEGALGSGWFLVVYLLGGYCAGFASLALHWGEHGLMLGASGAIATLMGAFCVLWGLRKVRVFYWLFIVFDYVRVPALWLLPVWLGWQLYSLWSTPHAHVAFGAHAAGIASGVLMALALQRAGVVRRDYIEAEDGAEQRAGHDSAYAAAMEHIGRLELDRARGLLESIDTAEPGQLRVLAALYRCARYQRDPVALDAAIGNVLTIQATTPAEAGEVKALYEDYLVACAGTPRVAPALLLRQVHGWLRLGCAEMAEAVLRSLERIAPPPSALAAAWFALALHAPEASRARQTRLEHLARAFPRSPYASKARFLLQQD